MLIHKIFFVNVVILLVHICSCNNNPKSINSKKSEVQKQNFKKDIPITKKGKFIYAYSLTKEYIQKAGLRILENGFDSICIRLWYIYSFGPSWQVTEMRKSSEGWVGEFILLTEKMNKNDSSRYIQKTSFFKKPISGWDIFIMQILSKNITFLPSDLSIPGYQINADGHMVVVEIATKEYYRIFDYSDLKFNLNIKEARNMADIMILIEKEFGVERLNKEF